MSVVFFCCEGLVYMSLCFCMYREVTVGGVCWMQNNEEVGGGSGCLVEKQCTGILF